MKRPQAELLVRGAVWLALGVWTLGCANEASSEELADSVTAGLDGRLDLVPIGTYEAGVFDDGAAEIAAHDPILQRLYVVNGSTASIDVLSIADPSHPRLEFSIPVGGAVHPDAAKANSVAVHPQSRAVAAAVENTDHVKPGFVAFFDVDGVLQSTVRAGSLPDMLTFTPNGHRVVVANEGEPSDDYLTDPEGSVTIVDVSGGIAHVTQEDVTTADFRHFNDGPLDPRVRIFGPGASVAEDLEPEFVAVSHDSRLAWVTLQENNAIATVDLHAGRVTKIVGLGTKKHWRWRNGIDASDKDDRINIRRWPTRGMYQPDSIATYRVHGRTFLLTANEGDARDYGGFSEETRVEDLNLDPHAFPNAPQLQRPENLGSLAVTATLGDKDNDGDYDELYSFGARSFSIWSTGGHLLYDSHDSLEQITARAEPDNFNSTNDENNSFDSRSDAKGPEPEGVVVGRVGGRHYAFVGLERIGGVAVYDISFPLFARFVRYVNNRDFSGDPQVGTAGDLGPEGLVFISEQDSPIERPLLVVANEVSGTTTLYEIRSHHARR